MMGIEINDADLDRTHGLTTKMKSYRSVVRASLQQSLSSVYATI